MVRTAGGTPRMSIIGIFLLPAQMFGTLNLGRHPTSGAVTYSGDIATANTGHAPHVALIAYPSNVTVADPASYNAQAIANGFDFWLVPDNLNRFESIFFASQDTTYPSIFDVVAKQETWLRILYAARYTTALGI
jgi:hypothetical protein